MACHPPKAGEGTVKVSLRALPLGVTLAVSGCVVKAQQVLAQLTRLPTTVAHSICVDTLEGSPLAFTVTEVPSGPLDTEAVAVTVDLTPSPPSLRVVTCARVGATVAGQSIDAAGGPSSAVTVNVSVA